MPETSRIPPAEAHKLVESGEALLVCAYDDEDKCRKMGLEGSVSLKRLESQLSSIGKDRLLVFY